jgi:hypothetical protein
MTVSASSTKSTPPVGRADRCERDPDRRVTYIIWRVKSDWRRPADAAAQRERARYFAT